MPTPSTYNEAPLPSTQLAQIPTHERPQERLEKLGARALQDAELIAMLLRTGTAGEDVLSVASRLVHTAGSLGNLVSWTQEDFVARRGIGHVKALQLVTVMEIARRIVEQGKESAPVLDRPQDIFQFFQDIIQGLEVEKCWVLCLNTRHRLIRCEEVTSGTLQNTLIEPREVLRFALRLGAAAIVIVHNHPSGDPEPSKPDITSTRRMREAADVMDIALLDHVILGNPANDRLQQGWFSFKLAGVL
ncbi:MAG: DNA repair protein RadC [Puniceicoccales bacterium]|jgi:DNA repair protein RadC|nr:DNA repair protein RadC [Puniceicoccales bacterium]